MTKSVNGAVTSYAYEEGTDRLASYGAETIEYDGMGNITKAYENGEMKIRYEYNALNRLVREDNKDLKRTEVYWKMVKKNVTKYGSEN